MFRVEGLLPLCQDYGSSSGCWPDLTDRWWLVPYDPYVSAAVTGFHPTQLSNQGETLSAAPSQCHLVAGGWTSGQTCRTTVLVSLGQSNWPSTPPPPPSSPLQALISLTDQPLLQALVSLLHRVDNRAAVVHYLSTDPHLPWWNSSVVDVVSMATWQIKCSAKEIERNRNSDVGGLFLGLTRGVD